MSLKNKNFTLKKTTQKPTINKLIEFKKIKTIATIYTIETTTVKENLLFNVSKQFKSNLTTKIQNLNLKIVTQMPTIKNLSKLSMF